MATMIDKTFWGLLDTQIESLKNSSGKESNALLLETAKLLLSNVDCSPETLSEYDKFDIRELFAAYSDVASETVSFYEHNKDKLDPVALNGKMGQKLDETTQEITIVSNNLKELSENEKTLLSKEEELKVLESEYKTLNEKVISLKAIRDTMTPAVLVGMKEEIESLESQIKKSSKEHGKLKKEIQALDGEYKEIDEQLSNLSSEKDEKCNQLIALIKEHYDTLKLLFNTEKMSIDDMLSKIEAYKETYNRMETAVRETSEILSMYELQLGENSSILESMKKYGVKSLDSVLEDIECIKQTIEEDLKAYDLLLQKVLIGEENIRKEVERRQGKHV